MTPREKLNAIFEAASGELDDEDREPVFISLRSSGADVVRLKVRGADRTMHAAYEIVDPQTSVDDMVILFYETYLRTYTDDYWREHVDRIRFHPAENEHESRLYPYPPRFG